MTNKKLGLLLLPLVPLSALGIVEIVDRVSSPAPVTAEICVSPQQTPPPPAPIVVQSAPQSAPDA